MRNKVIAGICIVLLVGLVSANWLNYFLSLLGFNSEPAAFSIEYKDGMEIWKGAQETRRWVNRYDRLCSENSSPFCKSVSSSIARRFLRVNITYNEDHTQFCINVSVKPRVKETIRYCILHYPTIKGRLKCLKELAERKGINVSRYDWKKVDFKKVPAKLRGIQRRFDVWNGYYGCFPMPTRDGETMQIGWGTEYWDTTSECNIDSPRSRSDTTIVFTCDININSELNSTNVTWEVNATSNYQYNFNVNSGGEWRSKDDTFSNYSTNYNYKIEVNSGGWMNLSSVENCYDDLDIYCYDGSTCYIDDYYGNSRCTKGKWHLYAQSNTTIENVFYDGMYLEIDSTESPVIYNFDAGSSSVSGNMTTGDNVVKWITSRGYYWRIGIASGATGTVNLTESSPKYIENIRTQRLNMVNSSIQLLSHLDGSPTEVACKNSNFGTAYYDPGYKSKIWSVGDTTCTLGQMRTYDGHHSDFSGYLDVDGFWHLSGTFYFNRTYPICAYSDAGLTGIGSGYNISLYCWNTSATEGSAITDADGCANVKVADMNQSWDNYEFEIRVDGTGYRNITVWQDSTETDGNGNLVGFVVENVSVGAPPPPSESAVSNIFREYLRRRM